MQIEMIFPIISFEYVQQIRNCIIVVNIRPIIIILQIVFLFHFPILLDSVLPLFLKINIRRLPLFFVFACAAGFAHFLINLFILLK